MSGCRHSAWLAVALILSGCGAGIAESAAVFMYHHVDTDTPVATSTPPGEFRDQMNWLEEQGFTVLPLLDLIEQIRTGQPIPDRAVAITFDDAYSSVLISAMPELRSRNWPFTVFVSTEAVDQGYRGYLSWDELRTLGEAGASFGNHTVSHTHLVRRQDGESENDWSERIRSDVQDAQTRLTAELGDERVVSVFAYPYGEYTREVQEIVAEFATYALGQQSGAIGTESDFLALPRYPVATGMALDEFALRARSKALPVRLLAPEVHVLSREMTRPELHLSLTRSDRIRSDDLACYSSGQGLATLEWLNSSRTEFRVKPSEAFGPGRSKINCTAPSATESGVWYWFGYVWMRRQDNGDWYAE